MRIKGKQASNLFITVAILTFISTFALYAAASNAQSVSKLISVPITHKNTKTYTIIRVGNDAPPAKVTVDTGSSMLVLEQRYISNYHYGKTYKNIKIVYGSGSLVVHGRIVYANVTFNTKPKITANNVPIVMVPNGSFHDKSGIMGFEMNNQVSAWLHLPRPYNQMMIIDGSKLIMSFGVLTDDQINSFGYYRLTTAKCVNKITPLPAYANYPCWATRKIPITYTFESPEGQTILKIKYRTIFDTGGVLTHVFIEPIPAAIERYTENSIFKGKIFSAVLYTDNQGPIHIPTTKTIKIYKSKKKMVNSGYQVFYTKTVLFDSRDGIIGFK